MKAYPNGWLETIWECDDEEYQYFTRNTND
jgi:hypothetical protein